MVLEASLVNVCRDIVVNDVKIVMVAPANHVKIMVSVSAQVVVPTHANVQQVMMDPIANKVCPLQNSSDN